MLKQIIDWGEVWPLIIPIFILIRYKRFNRFLNPVAYYIIIAFFINLLIDIMWKFATPLIAHGLPYDNNFLYNTHSILRFLLFSWFVLKLKPPLEGGKLKIIPIVFLILIVINFVFFDSFKKFSSTLLAGEAAFLLFYCFKYYFNLLQDDKPFSYRIEPVFWVITGLCIFNIISFFIFLFYNRLNQVDEQFAVSIWDIHNISYIIFCIFLSKAFYVARTQ
jgi:hypothetical protein